MSDKNKQTTFSYKWEDDDGNVQVGTFTTKRLSVLDRSKLSVRKSQLSGGMYCVRDENNHPTGQGIDPDTDYLNTVIAHLELALIQKPIWFKLDEISDVNVLYEIYEKVLDFEMTFFRRRDRSAAEGSQSGEGGETSSSPEPTVQGPGAAATQVVGQEVQAALDA